MYFPVIVFFLCILSIESYSCQRNPLTNHKLLIHTLRYLEKLKWFAPANHSVSLLDMVPKNSTTEQDDEALTFQLDQTIMGQHVYGNFTIDQVKLDVYKVNREFHLSELTPASETTLKAHVHSPSLRLSVLFNASVHLPTLDFGFGKICVLRSDFMGECPEISKFQQLEFSVDILHPEIDLLLEMVYLRCSRKNSWKEWFQCKFNFKKKWELLKFSLKEIHFKLEDVRPYFDFNQLVLAENGQKKKKSNSPSMIQDTVFSYIKNAMDSYLKSEGLYGQLEDYLLSNFNDQMAFDYTNTLEKTSCAALDD